MTYQPLHHKYRPQRFADLVGQEAIAATLTHAIQQQRIAPAYLFTGARGTGKTSSARILAKSLNCLQQDAPTEKPCGKCEVCRAIANSSALDVIEIDAASNTGVDNIRELIERSQFAPVQCRYKVYVIDECHMLSTAAFNALLKTLEEPPDRVVFVLATTDPQRVLPTIISRCQRFDFRRIPLDSMVKHLRQIADQEAIAITQEALTLVAQISQGGLRDAESLLDQLSLLAEEVTVDKVWDLVGSVPERDLMALLEAIAQDDPEALLNHTRRLMDRGREPLIVLQNLASFYRDLLIARTAPERGDLVALTQETWSRLCEFAQTIDIGTILAGQQHLRSCEIQLKNTTQPRLWLEITLMGLLPSAISSQSHGVSPAVSPRKIETVRAESVGAIAPTLGQPRQTPPVPPAPTVAPQPDISVSDSLQRDQGDQGLQGAIEPEPEPPVDNSPELLSNQPVDSNLNQIWQQIIAHLHPLSKALLNEHGQLLGFNGQEAQIGISSDKLVKIAQNQLKNIEKAFADVFHQQVRVTLEVAGPVFSRATSIPSSFSPDVGSGQPNRENPEAQPTADASPESSKPAPRKPIVQESKTYQPGTTKGTASPHASDSIPGSKSAPASNSVESETLPQASNPEKPPVNSWEEDEAIKAAKQLAEFFGGKVVSDNEEIVESIEPEALEKVISQKPDSLWSSPDEAEDSNDDSDVPF